MTTRNLILTIAVSAVLAGCASRSLGYDNPRSMANMSAAQLTKELSGKICSDAWRPTTYSSTKDTPETVEGNRANNRAREAFCK